jgi:hypothetical protein
MSRGAEIVLIAHAIIMISFQYHASGFGPTPLGMTYCSFVYAANVRETGRAGARPYSKSRL